MSKDHIPRVSLPTTAQFNATIAAIENAPPHLRPLANPISWLRDRLDPLHALEEADKHKEEQGPSSTDESDEALEKMSREVEEENRTAVVPSIATQPRYRKSKPTTMANIEENIPDMDDDVEDKSWDLMGQTFRHRNLGPDQQPLSQNRYDSQERSADLAGRTYKNNKSSEAQQQRDKQYHKKETQTRTQHGQISERIYKGDEYGPAQEQRQDLLQTLQEKNVRHDPREPEHMEVTTLFPDSPPLKVRPHSAEEERVAQDLAEAIETTHFKVWPRNPSPTKSEMPSNIKESIAYQAPLDKAKKARKQQLLEEWSKKEERDIESRRRVRGGYEDEVEKNALMSTDMFTPTLEPFVRTGKRIPTREKVREEYESGSSGDYEDAMEFLPRGSRYPTEKNKQEQTMTAKKADTKERRIQEKENTKERLRIPKEKNPNEKEKTQKGLGALGNKPSRNETKRKSKTQDDSDKKPKFPPDQKS